MSVVQLSDMKAHLNLTTTDDDALVQGKIDAVEAYLQQLTGLAFLTQSRVVHFDSFWRRRLKLPVGPVQSVTSITYLDQNLTQQTLDSGAYVATPLNSCDPCYVYATPGTFWPQTGRVKSAVTVTLQAGYGEAADVPLPLVEAVKLLVASLYENRESTLVGITAQELPFGLMDLIAPYRSWAF